MAMIEIRDAALSDWADWRRMWSANCAHFGVSIVDADARELWSRIMDPEHPVGALVSTAAAHEGLPVGFAHYVLHPHTFSDRMVCYLEDLWVDPVVRGGGIGRGLIDALTARGRERGWRRIYWHTEANNSTARVLYDRVALLTEYVRYDIALP
jgi:GNAT superfamily N-acetyltransferase